MTVIRADVTTEVLAWAREQSGLDIEGAARIVGVTPARLKMWEDGEAKPTLRQLRLLGKAYRRPSAFFFKSELPLPPPELTDFRLVPGALESQSPALRYEIRRARSRREIALELLEQMGDEPLEFPFQASRSDGSAQIAEHLRENLGVDLKQQKDWADQYEALRGWIKAAERTGVLVSHFSNVEMVEARAFSIADRPLPVVALNGKDSPRGRIFSLLHELCHIALDLGGICDLHDQDGDWIEPFCNATAGEALVPRSALMAEPLVTQHNTGFAWEDDELRTLANHFMVSQEVILRRLLDSGETTKQFYEEKREEYLEYYRRRREEASGFIRYFRKVIRDNGTAYTSLVLNAHRQHVISSPDLSRFLGDIKLSHIPSIEQAIAATW